MHSRSNHVNRTAYFSFFMVNESVQVTRPVLVAGTGIIGLAIGYHLLRRGARVTFCDPHPPGSQTSSGNAGGIATTEIVPHVMPGTLWQIPGWLLDPLGPLYVRWRHLPSMARWLVEALKASRAKRVREIAVAQKALLDCVYRDLEPLLADIGLSHALHRRGALTVYESERSFAADAGAWKLRRELGIEWRHVGRSEIAEIEPALGGHFELGIETPDWGHVDDPLEIAEELAKACAERGASFLCDKVLTLEPGGGLAHTLRGQSLAFEKFVLAAGVWSAPLARQLGSPVPLESERGYNVTLCDPGVTFNNEVIFGDLNFVVTPLRPGLRIGGAAEFAGTDAPANFGRSDAMLKLASKVIPRLNPASHTRWMGHRPTLPDTIPIISRSPIYPQVYFAFGHSHLGLTQAATTGRLIAEMVLGDTPSMDMRPYRIDRF